MTAPLCTIWEPVTGLASAGTITVQGFGESRAVAWVGTGAVLAARLRAQQFHGLAAHLQPSREVQAYLWSIEVDRAHRGERAGSVMLAQVAQIAGEHGARTLWNHACPHDGRVSELVQYYERRGFEHMTDLRADTWPVLRMVCEAPSAPAAPPSGEQMSFLDRISNPSEAPVTPRELRRLFTRERERFARLYPHVARAEFGLSDAACNREPPCRMRDIAWCSWASGRDGVKHHQQVWILRRALVLPRANLTAVIRHELGHLVDPLANSPGTGAEKRADKLAAEIGGEPIHYDRNDLQTTGPGRRTRPAWLHQ